MPTRLWVVCVLAAGMVAGGASALTGAQPPVPPADDDILERINRATRRIAAQVEPTVVHISIRGKAPRARRGAASQGSGWVYDTQGHIVTNAHVADGAAAIVVQFHDGRTAAASLVGLDAATDIAVLKADGVEGLVAARRATGEAVAQGDTVFAFGSPFGFKFSMSQGVVSGLGRDPGAFSIDGYTNFIQSDAAVNPGNSGGPLVDVRGRVVGMSVAIATGADPDGQAEAGQSAGISFAIPLSTIEPVVEQLIASGTVSKGFLGVNMPLDDEANRVRLAEVPFLNGARAGVVVDGLVEGGPAEAGGLQPGDVIVGVGETAVAGVAQLRSLIATTRPGQTVAFRVQRAQGASTVSVGLVSLDAARANMAASALARFGIAALDDEGQAEDAAVRVRGVAPGSPAEAAGIRPGAAIVSVRGIPTPTRHDLTQTLVAVGFGSGARATIAVIDPEPDSGIREVTLTGRGSAAGGGG